MGDIGIINVGDLAPDILVTTTGGQPIRLSEFRGRNVVLVFLRHLG